MQALLKSYSFLFAAFSCVAGKDCFGTFDGYCAKYDDHGLYGDVTLAECQNHCLLGTMECDAVAYGINSATSKKCVVYQKCTPGGDAATARRWGYQYYSRTDQGCDTRTTTITTATTTTPHDFYKPMVGYCEKVNAHEDGCVTLPRP
jgi:hypothetical protein